jgi:hypothetical protein
MVPTKDVVCGKVGNSSGAVRPVASIMVVMKVSAISSTSLLDRASFLQNYLPTLLDFRGKLEHERGARISSPNFLKF